MTRRKVTMLDAFQASARESAERAAAERRRIVAEREREARREEALRTAGELRRQLGVAPRGPADTFGPDTEDGALSPETDPGSPEAPDPGTFANVPEDPIAENRVTVASFDAPSIAPVREDAPVQTDPSSAASARPGLDPGPLAGPRVSADDGFSSDAPPFDEEGAFYVPLSARGFFALQALLLASAFLLGWAIGGRGGDPAHAGVADGPSDGRGSSRASAGPPADFSALRASAGRGSAAAGDSPVGAPREGARPDRGSAATAAADGQPVRASAGGVDPPAPVGDGSTPADAAFRDPANAYTVLAITYISTETNIGLAWETYDQLRAEGFPVVRPIEQNARLYLFVGAAETRPQLDELEERLRGLQNDRNGSREFRSAYKVNIDPYR